MMLRIIEILFYFLALIFPLGQFSRLFIGVNLPEEVKIYFLDILVFMILLFWIIWHRFSRKRVCWPSFSKSLFGLFLGLFFSWLINLFNFSRTELLVGLAYLLRFFCYSFLAIILFDLNKFQSRINRDLIIRFYLWLGLSLSVLGLIQYLFIPDIRFLSPLGWDLHYYRVVGPFLDPNFLGILLMPSILLSVNKILKNKKVLWSEIPLLFLVLSAFFLTYSRGAYLSLIVGLGILLVLIKKTKLILLAVSLFLLFVFLLPRPGGEGVRLERTASIVQRIESWQVALKVWEQSPFWGIGFNNYRYQLLKTGFLPDKNWQQSHSASGVENSFLLVLATSGMIGAILLMVFLFNSAKMVILTQKSAWREFSFAGLMAILTSALFINSFFYPWVMINFWTILALGLMEKNRG